MKNSEILASLTKRSGVSANGRACGVKRCRGRVRYTLTGIGNGGGFISWSELTVDTADSVIQNQIEHYTGLKLDFEWKVYSYDQPADLAGAAAGAWFHCRGS